KVLFSVANALKVRLPGGSGLLSAVDHLPADALVLPLATSVDPSKTCTTTSVFSFAVPENEGFVLFDGVVGWLSVTSGGRVLTSKLTVLLFPAAFPSRLFSVACAVNVRLPAGSRFESEPVAH